MNNIYVKEFDSLYQMEAYLRIVNGRSTLEYELKRFMAMLKTAIILNDRLILFQANVFDGIFFLLFGPNQLREMLGFPSYENLPITIMGQSDNLENLKQSLEDKHTSLDYIFNMESHEFSFLFLDRGHTKFNSKSDYLKWLNEKRNEWYQAIENRTIELKNFNHVNKPFPLREVVLGHFLSHPSIDDNLLKPIYKMYAQIPRELSNKKLSTDFGKPHIIADYSIQEIINCVSNSLALVEKRWEIVTYLANQRPLSTQTKIDLFTLWNTLYLRSLAKQHRLTFLSFDFDDNQQYNERLKRVGLYTNRNNIKKYFRNLKRIKLTQIHGRILEGMLTITPDNYYQMYLLVKQNNNKDLSKVDLVNNLGVSLERIQSYWVDLKEENKYIITRILLLLPPSILISLVDVGWVRLNGTIQFFWILLVFLMGFPFEHVSKLYHLNRSRLSGLMIDFE